jgi:hypothetical protein
MMVMSNNVKTPKNKPWYEFHENKVKEGVSQGKAPEDHSDVNTLK